jgi:hypothetical protein
MFICAGIVVVWWADSPARGGGGRVGGGCRLGGTGTAPGCGGAGPAFCEGCVLEGAGGGGAVYGVGAGTAAAPGRAGGYAGLDCAAAVVVAGIVLEGSTCSSADVCGVTPDALVGVMGSLMWTGIGGISLSVFDSIWKVGGRLCWKSALQSVHFKRIDTSLPCSFSCLLKVT